MYAVVQVWGQDILLLRLLVLRASMSRFYVLCILPSPLLYTWISSSSLSSLPSVPLLFRSMFTSCFSEQTWHHAATAVARRSTMTVEKRLEDDEEGNAENDAGCEGARWNGLNFSSFLFDDSRVGFGG